jgi:hypothetical protein
MHRILGWCKFWVKRHTSNPFMAVTVQRKDETQSVDASGKNGQKIKVLCKKISKIVSMPQLDEWVPAE